jgi:hypothetical protein
MKSQLLTSSFKQHPLTTYKHINIHIHLHNPPAIYFIYFIFLYFIFYILYFISFFIFFYLYLYLYIYTMYIYLYIYPPFFSTPHIYTQTPKHNIQNPFSMRFLVWSLMPHGLFSTGEKYLLLTLCSVNIGSGVEGKDSLFTMACKGPRSFSFFCFLFHYDDDCMYIGIYDWRFSCRIEIPRISKYNYGMVEEMKKNKAKQLLVDPILFIIYGQEKVKHSSGMELFIIAKIAF